MFGYKHIAIASAFSNPLDIEKNTITHLELINQAAQEQAALIVFPDLSITGYSIHNLVDNQTLIHAANRACEKIIEASKFLEIIIIIGLPFKSEFSSRASMVIQAGEVLALIPQLDVANVQLPLELTNVLWQGRLVPFHPYVQFTNRTDADFSFYIYNYAHNSANICIHQKAIPSTVHSHQQNLQKIIESSRENNAAWIHINPSSNESTTDFVYDGSMIVASQGALLYDGERFLQGPSLDFVTIDCEAIQRRKVCAQFFHGSGLNIFFNQTIEMPQRQLKLNPHPFLPTKNHANFYEEALQIQTTGLIKRIRSTRHKLVLGISGGLDSTLALLVCLRALKSLGKNIQEELVLVTMPGFGTSNHTKNLAIELADSLGLPIIAKSINEISNLIMDMTEHDPAQKDVTYENIQARARTYLLMTIANQKNGLVVGTGDLSEIALGFCTYNADHISSYNVNAGVPNTLVRALVTYASQTDEFSAIATQLEIIAQSTISPELLPTTQSTEEIIGPYELHDFFLYYFINYGFSREKIIYMALCAFEGTYDELTIEKWYGVCCEVNGFSMEKRLCSRWSSGC